MRMEEVGVVVMVEVAGVVVMVEAALAEEVVVMGVVEEEEEAGADVRVSSLFSHLLISDRSVALPEAMPLYFSTTTFKEDPEAIALTKYVK